MNIYALGPFSLTFSNFLISKLMGMCLNSENECVVKKIPVGYFFLVLVLLDLKQIFIFGGSLESYSD